MPIFGTTSKHPSKSNIWNVTPILLAKHPHKDFGQYSELFFECLTAQAHNKCDLAPLFIKAAKEVQNSSLPNPRPGNIKELATDKNNLFIYLPYHPKQPLRKFIDLNFE